MITQTGDNGTRRVWAALRPGEVAFQGRFESEQDAGLRFNIFGEAGAHRGEWLDSRMLMKLLGLTPDGGHSLA